MGIEVKRPVRVMIVVTPEWKSTRIAEIRSGIVKLDAVARRLDMQAQKSSSIGASGTAKAILERLSLEKRRNDGARKTLQAELESVEALEIGTEYHRGDLEGRAELEVGDAIIGLGECDIVVKDDIIVEIRDGLCRNKTDKS